MFDLTLQAVLWAQRLRFLINCMYHVPFKMFHLTVIICSKADKTCFSTINHIFTRNSCILQDS